MLPRLPVSRGFAIASLCVIAGRRSTWREGEREKKEGERAVWTCLLFAGLSRFSINSAATHPTTGGQLSVEPRLRQNLQIHSHVTNMNISHQRDGSLFPQPLQTAWFPNDLIASKTAVLLNCIPDIQSMPATCLSTLHLLILPPPCFALFLFLSTSSPPLPALLSLYRFLSHSASISSVSSLSTCTIAHLHMRLRGIKKTHCPNFL